jgi:dephospho-CoA kinase
MIVTLAGPIGSGKSTLARAIAGALGAPSAGFGNYVRSLAADRDLDVERRQVLQDLGHELVQADARAFLDGALAWSGHAPGQPLLLDGLRHITILDALRAREAEGLDAVTLLYLDTPRETRRARVAARGVSVEQMEADEAHSAEQDLDERLRAAADAILDGSKTVEALTRDAMTIVDARRGA